MKLAIYQGSGVALDVAANLDLLAEVAATVAEQGGQFLIMPELFLTGYNIGDAVKQLAEPFEGASLQRVANIARDHQLHLLVGYAESADHTVYNSAALIDAAGNPVANYRKTHLFGSEEHRLFTPGQQWVIHSIAGFKVGILICYDVEFPEAVRALALQGAELIAVPTANWDARISQFIVPARALENQLFIAYANRMGAEGDLQYCGLSTIADPEGRLLVQADDQAGIWMAQLDRAAIAQARSQFSYLHERRTELYESLSDSLHEPLHEPTLVALQQ